MPRLDGMGVAEVMESCVGVQHISRDPSASLGILRTWSCALFHDLTKTGIECDGKRVRAKAALEAARDMKLFGEQHRAGIRRPPKNRLTVVIPGEDTVAVRFEETLRTKISTDGKEAFGGCLINRGKTKIVPIQTEHRQIRYVKRGKKTMLEEREENRQSFTIILIISVC